MRGGIPGKPQRIILERCTRLRPPRWPLPVFESPGPEYPETGALSAAARADWLAHSPSVAFGRWLPSLAQLLERLDPLAIETAIVRDFLQELLRATMPPAESGIAVRPWLPLVQLFLLTLPRVPGYLLRPFAVNPWPDRLMDWWLAPPELSGAPKAVPRPVASLRDSVWALSSEPLTARPVLATGYMGRWGERFLLGRGYLSRLWAPRQKRPRPALSEDGVTEWGEVFQRFAIPTPS